MPLIARRNERPVPAEAARLVQSVPRRKTSAEIAVAHLPGSRSEFTIGIEDFPSAEWVTSFRDGTDRPGIWGLGFQSEAFISAWWQTAVSPWLSTPAGLAVVNKIANGVAKIPLRMRNKNTDEIQDAPKIFRFPHGQMYNPSYTEYNLKHDAAYNLNRFGMCHLLTRYEQDGTTNLIRSLDSTVVQTCGTFTRPSWIITAPYGALAGAPSTLEDPDMPRFGRPIFPDGRMLKDRTMPECEWGMMFAVNNRLPATNIGAPAGMMVYNATLSATEAQRHSAEYFRDGTAQQMLLSPHASVSAEANVQESNEQTKKRLAEDQRAVITPIPYETKMIGFSAEDSQLVESREMDAAFGAIAHGMPASPYRRSGGSYAQAYVDFLNENHGAIYPVAFNLEPEFTRALTLQEQADGWVIEFDRSKLAELDPRTTAEILTMLAKGGHVDSDEVRDRTGFKPYGEEWSAVPTTDGNRRPVNKLFDITEAQITKGKQGTGRPQEKPGGEPERPEPPESK